MCSRICDVLVQVVGEVLLVEPVRLPVVDVAHADRFGMNFLSHGCAYSFGVSKIVRWLVRLRILRRASHRARSEPLDRRTLVGVHRLDVEVLADELVVVLGVRDRRLEQLAPVARDRTRRESEDSSRLLDPLAADVVAHQSRLARRRTHVLRLRANDRRRQARVALRLRRRVGAAAGGSAASSQQHRDGGAGGGAAPRSSLLGGGLLGFGPHPRLSLGLLLGLGSASSGSSDSPSASASASRTMSAAASSAATSSALGGRIRVGRTRVRCLRRGRPPSCDRRRRRRRGVSSSSYRRLFQFPHARDTGASARTHQACAPPSTPR